MVQRAGMTCRHPGETSWDVRRISQTESRGRRQENAVEVVASHLQRQAAARDPAGRQATRKLRQYIYIITPGRVKLQAEREREE